MQLWNCDVYRAVQEYRMEFCLSNMNVIWHKRQAHHSMMNWNLLCRYFDSRLFCFDTISTRHFALNHHSSPKHSTGPYVRLQFLKSIFNKTKKHCHFLVSGFTHNESVFLTGVQIIGWVYCLYWFNRTATIHFWYRIIAVVVVIIHVTTIVMIAITIEIRWLFFQQRATIAR